MEKFGKKIENLFNAITFAEHGEWDDAIRMAEGSYPVQVADGKRVEVAERPAKRAVDHRPRLKL